MSDELAILIRKARTDAGFSREQVAAGLGVSLVTVVRMESGRTKRISAERLVQLGALTNKPLSFFLGKAAA